MAANATNTLQANITSTDSNGNTSINRSMGNPALAGVVGQITINETLAAGDNNIGTPGVGNVFNFYVKNNSAPGGPTIIVKFTPNGGVQQVSPTLQPGGVFVWWQVINSVAAGGITTIILNASAGGALVEWFSGA